MWWFIKKAIDNHKQVVYDYGFESKKVTGRVSYDRAADEFCIEKLADGDSEIIAKRFLFRHLHRAIFCDGCPDEKQIAIG